MYMTGYKKIQRVVVPCILFIPLLVMAVEGLEQHPIITLIDSHLERYPRMQIQDVYKMLYQGEFGVQHILHNPDAARNYLTAELEQVTADSSIQPAKLAKRTKGICCGGARGSR